MFVFFARIFTDLCNHHLQSIYWSHSFKHLEFYLRFVNCIKSGHKIVYTDTLVVQWLGFHTSVGA